VPRDVTLLLCSPAGRVLGALPPFTVDSPWWPDVEPFAPLVRERHGLEVIVVRLLEATGDDEGTGGAVAYLAEVPEHQVDQALDVAREAPPGDALRALAEGDDPRRQPWARPGGVADTLAWADHVLAAAGRQRRGAVVQVKTWNLSSVLRLPMSDGDVWCKSVPAFFAHEGPLVARLAEAEPGLVPPVVAYRADADGESTVLLEGVPGVDQWEAPEPVLAEMAVRWVHVQDRWAAHLDDLLRLGLPDRRAQPLLDAVRALVARPDVRSTLPAGDLAAVDLLVAELPARLAALDACGLPATLVHGDLHPGNWVGDGTRLALVDWGDSAVGHPMVDVRAFLARVPAGAVRDRLWSLFAREWARRRPGSDAAGAMRLVAPVAALTGALVYRTFLDGIEATEQRYHARDVPAMLRLAVAEAQGRTLAR
jgi:aminoglycoside phosphotransferase (APT) family kinase protein